jgi:GNAT superfamily N-acetyltransferase
MTVREAGRHEAGEIVRVINAAFNPAESFFVDGDRIDLEQVLHYFEKGMFLVAGEMAGCVYVELRGERAYFGLLSVDPARQRGGIGGVLIRAAEDCARAHGCRFMDIRIVNLREELPAFYGKLGYTVAGTEEFTPGSPTKLPCHFIKMQKRLAGAEPATA